MRLSAHHCCIVLAACIATVSAARLNPVIMVPGSGSILQVKVNGQRIDENCPTNGEFEISFTHSNSPDWSPQFSPTCMNKMLELEVDHKDGEYGSYKEKQGITTTVKNPGSYSCLAPLFRQDFQPAFSKAGYIVGKSLRIFCYDWRMAPETSLGGGQPLVDQLEELVKETFRDNGAPVWLMSYSQGGVLVNKLLQVLGDDKELIGGYIALAPVTVGVPMTVHSLFSGMDLTAMQPDVDSAYVRQTWPSTYATLPDPHGYGKEINLITDTTSGKKYTAVDLHKLFVDAGLKLAAKLWRKFNGGYTSFKFAPGVHVFAFYGTGDRTPVGWEVVGLGPQMPKTVQFTDGDMIVDAFNKADMMSWKEKSFWLKKHFEVVEMKAVDHFQVPAAAYPRVLEILKGNWVADIIEHDEL